VVGDADVEEIDAGPRSGCGPRPWQDIPPPGRIDVGGRSSHATAAARVSAAIALLAGRDDRAALWARLHNCHAHQFCRHEQPRDLARLGRLEATNHLVTGFF